MNAPLPSPRPTGQRPVLSRRHVLQLGAAATLLAGAGTLGRARPALAAGGLDYTSPDTFDAFYRSFVDSGVLGQSIDYNDIQGALAWGQTYVQQGLLRMYAAYHDRRHLHTVLDDIDDVLASRDSERGVAEYRGLSLPAWRAGYPYTAGGVTISDANGLLSLQLRSVRTPIETLNSYSHHSMDLTPNLHVEVSTASNGQGFDLRVRHDTLGVSDEIDGLTMDTVVQRLRDAWPTNTLVTAVDLRAQTGGGEPAPGTFEMASQPVIYAVHTGMITYPIAWAARTILENPKLRRDPGLARKAAAYVAACRAAVAVHDDEWRENAKGEGWYVFPRGAPMDFNGTELPANQFLAPARTMVHMYALTGDRSYRDRAAKMAKAFENQLLLGGNGAYTWHYWMDWSRVYTGYTKDDDVSDTRLSYGGARQVEDISHGHIDVDLAILAFRNHVAFKGADMARFAKTFTRNIATTNDAGEPTVWTTVAGDGNKDDANFDKLAAGWIPTASWDAQVFRHVLSLYQRRDFQPSDSNFGFTLLGLGNLGWFAKVG